VRGEWKEKKEEVSADIAASSLVGVYMVQDPQLQGIAVTRSPLLPP